MRKALLILIVLLTALGASGKLTQFVLRGYVQEQDYSKTEWQKHFVDSVYVSLVQSDTILVPFKLLSGDDDLKLSTAGELRMIVQGGVGNYSLLLNRQGYEPLCHDFKVASEGQDIVYLRSVYMEPRRENALDEVTVVGTAIKMVMKGDTIVYDSAAFKLPEGSTLDALVRQLPGAELADDGSITVNGKKVQSLLLNGQDFFKGDPDVALKNLPSYTVDKIKVYDKAAKDDYLTLASHRLDSTPDDETLVMDVTLKKEFSMATILNVEGGYGPGIHKDEDPRKFDNRYLGRAFLIGFGKTYRFSAFGNVNNIKNTAKATSSNKDWGSGWDEQGELRVAMGGFDVFYNPTKRWELTADMQYSKEDIDMQYLTSRTQFFDTGNLNSRSRRQLNDNRNHLKSSAGMLYLGDNVSVHLSGRVDWLRSEATQFEYDVNFSRNPVESSRGGAIDSLFALVPDAKPSRELRDAVTSSSYRSYRGHSPSFPDWLDLLGRLNVNFSPKSIRGSFNLNAGVRDVSEHTKNGRIYLQTLADPTLNPVRREQWNRTDKRNTDGDATIRFNWNKRQITDTRITTFSLNPTIGWSLERSAQTGLLEYELLLQGIDPTDCPLPSVTAPENRPTVMPDGQNTVNSLFLNNRAQGTLSLGFNSQPTAPGDSTWNPTYNASVYFSHYEHFRHLSYGKPYLADPEPFRYHVNDIAGSQSGRLSLSLSSNNKVRYLSFNLNYSYSNSLLNLFTLVPSANTSDPLNVYLGPEAGSSLPRPETHRASFSLTRWGNKRGDNAWLSLSYSTTRNATAQTSVFNPSTGVTTHRPISVNGNWNAGILASYSTALDADKRWHVDADASAGHNNSVDYVSASGEAVRSNVRNENVTGHLRFSYSLKNGTRFSLGAGTDWLYSTSPREGFHSISATASNLNASINFYLPWQIEGETNLRAEFRRGYEDSALNTTEWIWNASIQKTILKGNMTFKLQAVDILGQLSNISYRVNAQGRTETWTNNLPRYVLLTVSYRFNFTPKALKM